MNASTLRKPQPSMPVQNPMEPIGIRELVAVASDVVAPVWPLKTFIAVNPLQGLEDRPFEQAVLEAACHRATAADGHPGRAAVNRELIKWCAVFFDEGQATLSMPGRHLGLYRCFVELARFDRRLNRTRAADTFLRTLPDSAAAAVSVCLDRLGIPQHQREDFLRQSLAALAGWSGYVKWKECWQSPAESARHPVTLVDLVAVRLVLTCLLWPEASYVEVTGLSLPSYLVELPAAEARYRQSLLVQLRPPATVDSGATPRIRPKAQLVFCIDVRSEPFRRAIEAQGAYETLGFAGFFGVPVRVKGHGADHAHDSCPVLLKPSHEVQEHPCAADAPCASRHEIGRGLLRFSQQFYQSLKYNFTTPFALVEILGPWCGLGMLAKTFAPSFCGRLKERLGASLMPVIDVTPSLAQIRLEQQAAYGEQALRMMGLTSNYAPLVVLCGHGSTVENNPFASSLQCGACGGNHGGPNARILATILNQKNIRALLATRGLPIPDDTLFVAAEHDTTTDKVTLYGVRHMPTEHVAQVAELERDLATARTTNATVRLGTCGQPASEPTSALKATYQRSQDWAQVRPEWGLARNAAFIVGPRAISRHANLEGRCFLHSYDWTTDADGKFLTTILTAPMVVAQWINSQYLFSTLDNVAYGAGSKVTQNVTGKIGVMQGNASDLMHGLPLQSVHSADDAAFHEPLRLLTVVHAPRSTLNSIIGRQQVLQKLFGNGWVMLACLDPVDGRTYVLNRDLTWQSAA